MSEFRGPSLGWYEQPQGHEPECNCEPCHQWHLEQGKLVENAENGMQCCADEIEALIEERVWCREHGDVHMSRGNCEECLENNFRKAV